MIGDTFTGSDTDKIFSERRPIIGDDRFCPHLVRAAVAAPEPKSARVVGDIGLQLIQAQAVVHIFPGEGGSGSAVSVSGGRP